MKTPPNPTIDPQTLNNLLHALLDGDLPFPDLAAKLGLSIANLAALITSPEVARTIDTLREALIQRSRLLSVTSQTAALSALCTVMDELGEAPARQQTLEAEKAAAEKQANTPKAEAAAKALAALEARDKQLAELSRSARATLTYARATRADFRHEIPQQSLRLAVGTE